MTDSRDSIEYWKEKYYESLREQEETGQVWEQLRDLLCKAVTRLVVLADGLDPALDPHLAKCRSAVKNGVDEQALQEAIGRLTDTIIRPNAAGQSPPGQVLGELLKRLQLPHIEDEVQQFRERVALIEKDGQIAPLMDELAKAMVAWLEPPKPEPAEKDPRLCALLVAEVLNQLMERLAPPADMSERLERLRRRLDEGSEAGVWTGMMVEVSDLAAAIRARINDERRETERFLVQVTDRLQELDEHFRGSAIAQEKSTQDGQSLDDALQRHVQSMEASMREAGDLEQLKQAVNQNLEALQKHMLLYRQGERERHMHAEQQVKLLKTRLGEMEQETRELRARIQHHRKQALVDPLTGISNRLAFDERMAEEYARWQRYGHPLSLIVWDVDHFKRINDKYGHQSGDNVLKTLARLMAKNTRETDYLARYGGEEFVVILPDADIEGAMGMADKLRKAVEKAGFRFRGNPITVTISCGVTSFGEGDTPATAFARADQALYQAKRQGRNRCVPARA